MTVMEDAMDCISRRSIDPWIVTLASVLAAMLLLVAAAEVLAGHAIGPAARRDWTGELLKVESALERGDVSAALTAWIDAYGAALRSRHWEGMVAVADVYRRIGQVGGFTPQATAKAREIYLAALFRARADGSVEGVLRTADAFAALGDWEVVERALAVAETVAARNPDAQARVRAYARRRDVAPLEITR